MPLRRLVATSSLCLGLAALVAPGCRPHSAETTNPASADHASPSPAGVAQPALPPETVEPFYVGLSSLDVEENERAARLFAQLSHTLPAEPAVWANLGLARLRLGDTAGADGALIQAAKLAPSDDRIAILQATAAELQGRYAEAITRLRALDAPSIAVLHRLAELLGRTGQDANPQDQLALYDRILSRAPENLVAVFERARLLARLNDRERLAAALPFLEAHRAAWGPAAARQLDSIAAAARAGNARAVATSLAFLQNQLTATPAYQASAAAVGADGGSIGRPLRACLTFRAPATVAAAADDALHFEVQPDSAVAAPALYTALALNGQPGVARIALAGGRLRIGDGSALDAEVAPAAPLSPTAVSAADFRGEGLPDLVLADADGVKIWRQESEGKFTPFASPADLSAALAIPAHGVWPLDYDGDGDLDLLVAREGVAPRIFRNNGDGTFTSVPALDALPEIRTACWSDFDGDGNGDLAFLDATGRLQLAWNQRAGIFAPPVVLSAAPAVALASGDVFGRGDLSLVVLEQSGALRAFTFDSPQHTWSAHDLGRWSGAPDLAAAAAARRVSLTLADLDNNGAVDVVASAGSATAIWLNQADGRLQPLARAPALFVATVADIDADGLLDLVGTDATGAMVAHTRSTKHYHWQSIQARARTAVADGRINSYGIGGRVEIRAGPLLAMAPITAPSTHFGLGLNSQVGVARIVWPNGVAQVEFGLAPDQQVTATQRLKGSCPWVFARRGDTFRFVKDFIWRSPLGMRINSRDTAGVGQTEDWILVPGDFLAPDDHGDYELRITAELWETHFFDRVALRVVDHPADVAALVDERFVPAAPPRLAVLATTAPQPLAEARDESGRDVRPALAASDGATVDAFPLGRYQGIAADHWIEFRLPAAAPAGSPLALVGEGWIYPTDSSLNVAISQGSTPKPSDLVLEEYDAARGWHAVSGDLGFPAGKNKTVVIPLPTADATDPAVPLAERRFRLRTNLEIYWDRLGWAVLQPHAPMKIADAPTLVADLRYRGYSQLPAPQRRKPDVPSYEVAGRGQRWQDLEGFYTRYGDIRELLAQTDDRYVIMNAGDEIVLRFAAPPPPPAGWTRDFVLVGDGWVKDGDFNTANSRTVLPLPAHDQPHYGGPADPRLAEDPVYLAHADDWRRFHTRYVAPARFERGLMADLPASPPSTSP